MILNFEKNGRTYSADTDKLPAESLAYLLQYGWSQSLQDCIAGRAKRVAEELRAKDASVADGDIGAAVEQDLDGTLSKRADSIIAGTMGQRDATPRDPFATMCHKIATEILRGACKAQNVKMPKEDKLEALLKQVGEKYKDKIETEARRRLAAVETFEIELA